MSQEITVKTLLEAGVHFGHHTNRWNPKMERYIFTARNKVYIIDLEKTLKALGSACNFLRGVAEKGKTILLVGTKRQAQQVIFEMSQKTEMPYVNQRWLGGMLTNFETVRKSVRRLEELEQMETEGTYQFLTKKEVAGIRTQREKLLKVLVGVRYMKSLPDAIFVVDPNQEEIAVHEARILHIPVAAIVDTNCNPDLIDYPIPGNDDAIRSVKLICETVGSAIEEGRNRFKQIRKDEELAEEAAKAQAKKDAEEAERGHADEPKDEEIIVGEDIPVPKGKTVIIQVEDEKLKRKAKRIKGKKETKESV